MLGTPHTTHSKFPRPGYQILYHSAEFLKYETTTLKNLGFERCEYLMSVTASPAFITIGAISPVASVFQCAALYTSYKRETPVGAKNP